MEYKPFVGTDPGGVTSIDVDQAFSALPPRRALQRLRAIMNTTIGDYRHTGGQNIKNNRYALGPRVFQPGSLVDVFRTDPFIVGPQNFFLVDTNNPGTPYPFGSAVRSNRMEPAGCSLSLTPRANGVAYIMMSCGIGWSYGTHAKSQLGSSYKYHDFRLTSKIHYSINGSAPVGISTSECEDYWRMTTDSAMANSVQLFSSLNVVGGSRYDFKMQVEAFARASGPVGHGVPAAPTTGTAFYFQMIGTGSSATVAVVYK